jgi:glycosyltransferase involved in cell wall biosynthesis
MYEVGVPMLRPNLLLDISDLMPIKEAAMACFVSQLHGQAYDRQIRALNLFRSYTLGPNVTFAEAYRIVNADELACGPFELYESEYQRQRSLGLPMTLRDIPLVSVIIRCRGGMGLQRSLDSIALQTYPNVEVVVVPEADAQISPLGEACGRYPLKQLNPSEPLAKSSASNLGMETARGQYLVFLDENDIFLADHLDKLTSALTVGASMVAYTGVAVKGCSDTTPLDEPWSLARLRGENFLVSAGVLFHRSLVEKGCRFRSNFGDFAEWDFWLQMSAHTPFLHTTGVSAIIRRAVPPAGHTQGSHVQMQERDVFYEYWIARTQPHEWSQTLAWFERNLKSSQSTVSRLREDILQLKSAIADAARHQNDLQLQLNASQAHCHSVDDRFDQLQSLTDSWKRGAEAEKAEILRSTSWRMTAPFRQLARLFMRR